MGRWGDRENGDHEQWTIDEEEDMAIVFEKGKLIVGN